MTRLGIGFVSAAVGVLAFLALVAPFASGSTVFQSQATTTTITVKASEFKFVLSTKTLAKPGKVIFVVKNVGRLAHDFKINGKKTPLLQRGKSARLAVAFKKKAKYPYVCTVAGHAAAGMKGVFTVK